MIIEVELTVLLSKSSGLQRKHHLPAPPTPHQQGCVQGVGEKWIFSSFSRSFGYGYKAVRIMVNVCLLIFSKNP
jgi:hypothetical protein